MKKITLSLLLLTSTMSLKAQTPILDSVIMGTGYANEVYYTLEAGTKSQHAASDWHLGFSTNVYSGTIMINAGLTSSGPGLPGATLAIWPNGTNADFESVDTVGYSTWRKLINDSLTFEIGAFNQNSTGGYDYGWGSYNMSTHIMSGDSVYIYKFGNRAYKIDIIKKELGTITLRYADVSSNTAGTEVVIPAATYSGKNFVFFNLVDGQIKDRELAGWDLWATKYHDMYNTVIPDQEVTGILTNPKWEVSVVNVGAGNQASHTDYTMGSYVNHKNEIGQSYKSLAGISWTVTNSKVYYLQNAEGDIWKWYPTKFVGTSEGKTVFYKQKVAFAGLTEEGTQFVEIFPNPAQDQLTIAFDSKASTADIIVRNQMGQVVAFENINTTSGINQQKLDISALTKGVYFVEINQNGIATVKNVVKY